jgi:FtsZ-binding cell division protein ZapB
MELAAMLGGALTPSEPPKALRAKVLNAVSQQEAAKAGNQGGGKRPAFGGFSFLRPSFAMGSMAGVMIMMLGAVIGIVAVSQNNVSDLKSNVNSLQGDVADLQSGIDGLEVENAALRKDGERLGSSISNQQTFTYLTNLPGISRIVLSGTADAPLARGLVVTNKATNWGVVLVLNMDKPETGKTFQVWLEKDGVITPGPQVDLTDIEKGYGELYVKEFAPTLNKFGNVFITQEAKGFKGTAPTGKRLLAAPLVFS